MDRFIFKRGYPVKRASFRKASYKVSNLSNDPFEASINTLNDQKERILESYSNFLGYQVKPKQKIDKEVILDFYNVKARI